MSKNFTLHYLDTWEEVEEALFFYRNFKIFEKINVFLVSYWSLTKATTKDIRKITYISFSR